MGIVSLLNSRTMIATFAVAVLSVVSVACGGSRTETSEAAAVVAQPTVVVEISVSTPSTTVSTPSTPEIGIPPTSTSTTMAQTPQSTEPALINTPVPVANLAPDFTLPSILGTEYTLSDFRGEQPVVVVFYRAYW
jgi:hypothetical protein